MHLSEINFMPFMQMLSAETRQLIVEASALVHYQKGHLLHSRGADKPGLSIVKSGLVSASVTDKNGKTIIAALLGAQHCFGEFTLFGDLPRTHNICAIEESFVWHIKADALLQLFESRGDIAKALLRTSLLRNHLLLEITDAMRRLPLVARTAKILLIMAVTAGSQKSVKCSQEELSLILGVSRVSIGKALASLQELGLLSSGYGKIELCDYQRLELWLEKQNPGTDL